MTPKRFFTITIYNNNLKKNEASVVYFYSKEHLDNYQKVIITLLYFFLYILYISQHFY